MKKRILTLPLLLSCFLCAAQNYTANSSPVSIYTLEECLKMGIESNYSVRIARNFEAIADNNVTIAGFLPVITAAARQSSDNVKTKEVSDDNSVANQIRKSTTDVLGGDVGLTWKLFDGMAMFATRDIQRELLKQGGLNLRASVERLVSDISKQYYYIITQKNRFDATKRYLEISTLRYNQAKEKYLLKTISGLELTQAKMDFNADSSRMVKQQESLRNAYIQMSEMMNIDLDKRYVINDTIIPDSGISLESILESAKQKNTSILIARNGENISSLDLRIARADRYPSLNFSAGYRYNNSRNDLSSLRFTETNGLNYGFTVSAKIFNGMETGRRIRNASIVRDNSNLQTLQSELYVASDISQLYNTYSSNILMIEFEGESAGAAYRNLEAAVVMYRLGTMSGVAFREIQRSYLEAEDRKLDAIYQAKVSEISLNLLAGTILE